MRVFILRAIKAVDPDVPMGLCITLLDISLQLQYLIYNVFSNFETPHQVSRS